MDAIQSIQPLYSLSGFAVGLLVGLTGVGGGALMTPILILLFGIHPATAVGTDLLYAAATKTAGSLVHGYNRTVDWRVVRRLATGSVPMTVLTIWALSRVNITGAAAREFISAVLTIALFITALTLVFRERIVGRYVARVGRLSSQRIAVLTVGVGAVLGVLVSITSVGAGAIGVTALILLYPQLPTARIVGSDIAHAVPLTLAAGIGHWWLGSIGPAAIGIGAGHCARQLHRRAGAGNGASPFAGRNADRGGDEIVARYLFAVRRRGDSDDKPCALILRLTPQPASRSDGGRRRARRATPWRVRGQGRAFAPRARTARNDSFR
jgi:uncharacterized membrane protein YfcA